MSSYESFLDLFGNVVERNLMIATLVYLKVDGVIVSKENIIQTFFEVMDNLSIENKVSILRMYPILGDKVPASALDSTNEQSYLGVKNVSQETLDYLNDLNQKYLNKFKFPFVICVKKKSFDEVLIEIAERCTKLYEEEVSLGVEEVKKICEIRILDTFEKKEDIIRQL
ncbi:LOW QUALITY PROTEIN: 2-oxo-4-hydroxy-4-carboxy-5-ureidoimidazoline decarboxylase [Lepeophtheirus salmonis]|uniref:2-oxo-4-hydroxy-4-carboxy-5-ureidoimidazoline decarboxylase n=1 Tax=Lepeophtheirus salmonis TaxID=72036 RepID=D3PFP7_LEPSM|nr:LOW QUALITY PROTEIN: 2-oxo-4-hydroxy-4-carboxy-5-ureidoimidazoline decarboxylase-like [Lepeophtheirus salmonis]ADD24093.1 2-oxo-4-hydroxy-4-carboxy-5-ureidoimidazoline decarboxylase [Lepeophtheirus salmonis]